MDYVVKARTQEVGMKRRDFLRYSIAFGATLALGGKSAGATPLWARRGDLPPGALVLDAHAHPDQFYIPEEQRSDFSSTLLEIKQLGMAGSDFAAIGDGQSGAWPWEKVIEQIEYVNALEAGGDVFIVRTKRDVAELVRRQNVNPAAILSLEGARPIGYTPVGAPQRNQGQDLDILFEKGVRMITVMHVGDNQFGADMREHTGTEGPGLTESGRQLVESMIEKGMIVDGAHAYYRTLQDMAQIAGSYGVPIIDSHTSLSPRSVPNGSRLRTWDEMETIAETGGLVCTWPLQWERTDLGVRRWTIRDWAVENFELKKRFGAEHIALGTDGGGVLPSRVAGYSSILDLPELAGAMYEVGFRIPEIKLYMGGNFRRVLKACLPA